MSRGTLVIATTALLGSASIVVGLCWVHQTIGLTNAASLFISVALM